MDTAMNRDSIQGLDIPFLRLKRPHKKSRLGCMTCKQRRVKCDEIRPRCNRCRIRGLECTFPVLEEKSASSPPKLNERDTKKLADRGISSSPCSSPSEVSHTDPIDPRHPAGIRDTELAKYYLTHVMQTFAGSSVSQEQADSWTVFIPAVALDCPTVRHGLLTLAAICLHYDSVAANMGVHPSKYLEAAEVHGEKFVKDSRQKLLDLQPSEFDSALACSRLLCVLGFAFFRTHRQNGATFADGSAWTWLRLLRGVRPVYETILESGHEIDEIIKKDMDSTRVLSGGPVDLRLPHDGIRCEHHLGSFVQETRQDRFKTLNLALQTEWHYVDAQSAQHLEAAVDLLSWVTELFFSGAVNSLFRTVCSWISRAPQGFIDLLMGGSPAALAVYSHWLMLVVLVEDLWWVNDMGRAGIHEVLELYSGLDPAMNPATCKLLTWPSSMLDMVES